MPDELLKRLYSTSEKTHQAAITDILNEPDSAVETLLELLIRVTDPNQPKVPLTMSELEDKASEFSLTGDATLEDLVKVVHRAEVFTQSFRPQSEVIADLRSTLADMGRPAWKIMLMLAGQNPQRFVSQVNLLMLKFEDVVTVDDLLTALDHTQPRIQERAAYMLAKHDDPRIVPALVGLLTGRKDDGLTDQQSADEQLQEVAARALAITGQAGSDALLELYQHGDPGFRTPVTVGLMDAGDPRALDVALEWLLLDDDSKRLHSLRGVERMLDKLPEDKLPEDKLPRVMEAFVERVRQGNENSFSPASKVIAKLGAVAVEPMLALVDDASLDAISMESRLYALDSIWQLYQTTPEAVGNRLSEALDLAITNTSNRHLAAAAARIMARIPAAADSIIALLTAMQTYRDDADVLKSIVYSVGQREDTRALPILRDLLEHWQNRPQNFESFEVTDEIRGAIDRLEKDVIMPSVPLGEPSHDAASEDASASDG